MDNDNYDNGDNSSDEDGKYNNDDKDMFTSREVL